MKITVEDTVTGHDEVERSRHVIHPPAVNMALFAEPTSVEGWRTSFLEIIAQPPASPSPVVHAGVPPAPGLIEEHVAFWASPSDRLPAIVVRPATVIAPAPAVIVVHETGASKVEWRPYLVSLAHLGFVAVAFDTQYHGERRALNAMQRIGFHEALANAFVYENSHPFVYDTVWDIMRIVDYLGTRPDVDAARVGVVGYSTGGSAAWMAAAADPRIAAVAAINGVTSYAWSVAHASLDGSLWSMRPAAALAASRTGDDPVALEWEFLETFLKTVTPGFDGVYDAPVGLAAIAPRPLLIVTGDSDPVHPVGAVRHSANAARRAYLAQGAAACLEFDVLKDTGHERTEQGENIATAWLAKWLVKHAT